MPDRDTAVVMAHWETAAVLDAIAGVSVGVGGFARRHGLNGTAQIELAVAEVVNDAVGNQADIGGSGRLVVDVAMDGEYLTVRIEGDAPGAPELTLTKVLASRVDSRGAGGAGTSVLMEFLLPAYAESAFRRRRLASARTRPRARGVAPCVRERALGTARRRR